MGVRGRAGLDKVGQNKGQYVYGRFEVGPDQYILHVF